MIIPYHFQVNLPQYYSLGRDNAFPIIECCPVCNSQQRLKRHGFYERNAIEAGMEYRIPICRMICPNPNCKKTFSILPDFLLPYFQHTMEVVLQTLLQYWTCLIHILNRQLVWFYRKRFIVNSKTVEVFLREEGRREAFPEDKIKKAIMLLNVIKTLPRATFIRRWTNHFQNSFMANSFYRKTAILKMP